MRHISRRGFITTSGAALGALPFVRSVDALAQAANPVFRHGVASGDPLTDRVILWTRVTPKSSSRGAERQVGARARRQVRAHRQPRRSADRRRARFHGQGRRGGPRAGHDLLLSLRGRRRAFADRADEDAAAERRVARAPRRRVVLELAAGLLQRLRMPREARRPRRGAAPRRLHLRVRERAVRRRHRDRTHPRAGQGNASRCRTIASATRSTSSIRIRKPFTACIRSSSSGTITSSRTTRGGAARRITRRRPKATGRSRRAAAVQAYYEWMPIREDAQTLTPRIYRTFRFGDLADAVHARHAHRRPRSGGRSQRRRRAGLAEAIGARRGAGELARRRIRRIGPQQHDVERARPADHVRAASRRRAGRFQTRTRGTATRPRASACSTWSSASASRTSRC